VRYGWSFLGQTNGEGLPPYALLLCYRQCFQAFVTLSHTPCWRDLLLRLIPYRWVKVGFGGGVPTIVSSFVGRG